MSMLRTSISAQESFGSMEVSPFSVQGSFGKEEIVPLSV